MSLDINVFLKDPNDALIPLWLEELNKLGMECEIHPEFSFNDHSGFLPFKIKITSNSNEELMNKEYLTGFEFYMDNFDLEENIEKTEGSSLFGKLLGKKTQVNYFASSEIDEKLKHCNKVITFNWGSADTFELRMAMLSSATLARVAGGISCYPADDIWYNPETVVEESISEVAEYEKSLKPREFKLHEFEGWL
jgi:hypothetical protein